MDEQNTTTAERKPDLEHEGSKAYFLPGVTDEQKADLMAEDFMPRLQSFTHGAESAIRMAMSLMPSADGNVIINGLCNALVRIVASVTKPEGCQPAVAGVSRIMAMYAENHDGALDAIRASVEEADARRKAEADSLFAELFPGDETQAAAASDGGWPAPSKD